MILIGLTGGMGAGKSTVADLFKTLGIPVYNSDERAKALMSANQEVRKSIEDLLGADAYTSNGELNRSWIASQVFSDPVKLDKLNAIVHPAVPQDIEKWAVEPAQKNAPYMLQETAILFEENLVSRMNAVILVVADIEERVSRIQKRDHISREQILDRMKHQWTDEQKIPLSDYVIFNDQGRSLIRQVTDIDAMIRDRFINV